MWSTCRSRISIEGWPWPTKTMIGWCLTYPSEKYDSVGTIIPNVWKKWKNRINVPNHQPDEVRIYSCWWSPKQPTPFNPAGHRIESAWPTDSKRMVLTNKPSSPWGLDSNMSRVQDKHHLQSTVCFPYNWLVHSTVFWCFLDPASLLFSLEKSSQRHSISMAISGT